MIVPKMTKLAASRGVGAMIVVHILKDNESFSTRGTTDPLTATRMEGQGMARSGTTVGLTNQRPQALRKGRLSV